MVLIQFAGCNKALVVTLLCICVGINGFHLSSVYCNHIDIAPNFAGTLIGITNTFANFTGFLAPMVVSHIIENHDDAFHWQIVFYITAGILAIVNLLYCIMASGEEQSWNKI